jgi:PAS domain S-box-containing protein
MRPRSEGRSLVRRFAVGSLVAFLATGFGVAAVMSRAIRTQEESSAAFHARTVALEVVGPLLQRSDVAAPVTGERYRRLRNVVVGRVLDDGSVLRVKVWRLDGTIVFSDDPAAVGKRFTGADDLKRVGAGAFVSAVSDLSEPENAGDRVLATKLFETYVPFRLGPQRPVVAAIEVYQSYGHVQQEVDRLLTTLALVFGGGLAALYLVLMPVMLRTARRLRDRNEQLGLQASDLREAEAKYRALVEPLPAIVYAAEFEEGGRWLYVSPQIEQLLGFAPEELMADPSLFDRQLHPEDVERYRVAETQGRLAGGQLGVEYRMLAKDGRVVWFRDDAVVIKDDAGHPRFQQGVMFDITESKRAEEALRGALELEQKAAERLRALDQMRNSFLAAVSHELRTPLTSVLGFAVTLQLGDVSLTAEEQVEMLDRLVANARKLERLLTDLLDMDRIARGVLEPKLALVDVGELLNRVAVEIDVGRRHLRVDASPLEVTADGAKVERIVENLVINAARHTPVGSQIWVRVRQLDDGILIEVEDDGPGVPEDLRDSVFLPFHQGIRTNEHHPGTGIGLSLVEDFARLHGGRAWVEDRPGGGAAFRVFLPTAEVALGAAS